MFSSILLLVSILLYFVDCVCVIMSTYSKVLRRSERENGDLACFHGNGGQI